MNKIYQEKDKGTSGDLGSCVKDDTAQLIINKSRQSPAKSQTRGTYSGSLKKERRVVRPLDGIER